MSTSLFPNIYEKEDRRPKTKNGYYLDEVRSSIQKMIRLGKEEECYFWCYELYDSGYWRYLVRILVTISGEDLGLSNPQAMFICMTAYLYFSTVAKEKGEKKRIKCKECGHIEETKGYYKPHLDELGLLISLLCHSPKNRYVDEVTSLIDLKRKQGWRLEVDKVSMDGHTHRGRVRLKNEGVDPEREFYANGAKISRYKSFNKKLEKRVKTELMNLIGFPDLASS